MLSPRERGRVAALPRALRPLFLAGVLLTLFAGACSPAKATSRPAPAPTTTARPVTVLRLAIPSIGVDQATVPGEVDAKTNQMVAPQHPFDIAYYPYSGRPGSGNAVFSGHVDYHDVGPAVFWRLSEAKQGDLVLVSTSDGRQLRYRVQFNRIYDASNGPWQDLFGAHAAPNAVTIYTCAGDFDPASHSYDKRRVVRALPE